MKKTISSVLALILVIASVLSFAACGKKSDPKTITVGASSTPHAEILEKCKPILEAKGFKLDIRIMDDYVIPNTSVEDGSLDANYFQHTPYLNSFNEENKTHLVSVATVHYEPFGIYAGKTKALADLPDGAKIALPNDTTNEARALLLLAANGLITMKEGAGLTSTIKDIAANPHNYEFMELEASLVPGALTDVDIAVINGNYALGAGLKVSEALAAETSDSEAARTYGNILAVKAGNEELPKVKALVEALLSEEIAKYITETYDGAVVSMKK